MHTELSGQKVEFYCSFNMAGSGVHCIKGAVSASQLGVGGDCDN